MQRFDEVSQSFSGASKVLSDLATTADDVRRAMEEFGSAAMKAFADVRRSLMFRPKRQAIIGRKSRRKTWRKYNG